uniref:sushi, von Willebrand factor type A, EGF and pentraxin domain-containing protein 1-like n=1 Tax=Styela clava TaxID=7725 RepID=UPI00193A9702|nr:sushi, von Willebrand factor type A, EGF and pentraxin domain-containing protein 1-like [Styela clava]
MQIPIRPSFIGLILLVEAYLLIKGEQCWMPMICDDQPTWRDVNTERQCTKEQEEALEALTEQVHETESMLDQLQKRLEDLGTNSVQPSVVDVKETTTPQVYKDKKTTAPATSPWSTKEAFFSTFRPQTTKVEQSTVRTCPAPKAPDNGTVDTATALEVNQTIEYSCNAGYVLQGSNIGKCGENGTWGEVPTCVVRTCPAPKAPDNGTVDTATALVVNQTIKYSCNAGYVLQGSNIGKCRENGTWGEVPTCIVDLTCDFESSTNPTCGYTRVNGTFQREYRDNEVTGYVLAGNGTIRSLPKALAGNEELCMSVDIKDTSDGELMAKARNGTVTKAIWPFSASTTWKTEKFILKKVNSTDTAVQLELEASGNVELDNITTLNSSECYGLDTTVWEAKS